MLPVWCSCTDVPGAPTKSGSSDDGEVDLHAAAAALETLDGGHEVRRQHVATQQLEEGDPGMYRADHDRGAQLLAGAEGDAGDAPAGGQDARHRRLGAHLGAVRLGGAAAGGGKAAHAAAHEPPATDVPVARIAHRQVQQHVGRAGRVRPGPGADRGRVGEHPLQLLAFEPFVEQLAHAAGEQPRDIADAAHAEAARTPGRS